MEGFKEPCPTKLYLLKEYVACLDLHNNDVREYAQITTAGLDGDLMALVKKRLEARLDRVRDSRKRYTDHVGEHGCEFRKSE